MADPKTIRNLVREGKVYVYLADATVARTFLAMAEAEGFVFGDGAKPTSRHWSDVMAVSPHGTVSYPGAIGRMAFGCGAVRRVDFAKELPRFTD